MPADKEILTELQQVNEYMMTSLRMSDGMNLQAIKNKISAKHYNSITAQLHKHQHLIIMQNDVVKLTNAGKLFADAIAGDLFLV